MAKVTRVNSSFHRSQTRNTLSPAVFNIVLESVVRQVQNKAEEIKISGNQRLAMLADNYRKLKEPKKTDNRTD